MAARSTQFGERGLGRLAAVGLAVLLCTSALAACDSGGDGDTTSSTVAPTTPTTAAPIIYTVKVDLQLTGARPATLKGTSGACFIRNNGQPSTYVLANDGYPQLGPAGSVKIWSATTIPYAKPVAPAVKVYIAEVGMLSLVNGSGVSFADEQRVVILDAPILGAPGNSMPWKLEDPAWTLRGHIKGTIRCI